MTSRQLHINTLDKTIELTLESNSIDCDIEEINVILNTVYREKLGGYSSMFIGSNVLGFIPAVISCEIPYHETTVFILLMIAIVLTTSHMAFYYLAYRFCRHLLSTSQSILEYKRRFVAQTRANKLKVETNEMELLDAILVAKNGFIKFRNNLKKIRSKSQVTRITCYWLVAEKLMQVLLGMCSFVIVVLLIYPVAKFESMALMDIAQIVFTVWLFFINIAMLFFYMPGEEMRSLLKELGIKIGR